MTDLRREASPLRIVASGVTELQLDAFVERAHRAWQFVPEQLGYSVEAGWPTDWPSFLEALTKSDSVTIAVQVNGKRRGEVTFGVGAPEEQIKSAALAIDAVARALEGKAPKKVIVVPNRIVNIVA